jgi:hypothetical protein
LTIEVRVTGSSEARAALERGGRVVLVTPPAPEQAEIVWELLGPAAPPGRGPGVHPRALVLTADRATALDWAAAAPADRPVHPVTGLDRTARLLKEGAVDVLAGSVHDLGQLLFRAALKPGAIGTLVVAWPEALATGPSRGALDAFLAEAPDARRIILSWNPPALRDFLDRYAFKAPVVGDLPLDDTARPLAPIGPARYAIVTPDSRLAAIRGALDVLDPGRAIVWTPVSRDADRLHVFIVSGEQGAGSSEAVSVTSSAAGDDVDLVICARVPSRQQFAALAARGPVLLLLGASQLGYARAIASPLTAVRLPGAADRAADASEALRRRVASRLDAGDVDAELLMLEPLFERFDPAEVAGALVALETEGGTGKGEGSGPLLAGGPAPWVKLFVNIGKKDRVGAKDLVGALIHEVGLQKADMGRIELRDAFSTVEVAPAVAAAAAQKLSGVSIRGRRVQAKVDRNA